MVDDFKEIAHSGGTISFQIRCDEQGNQTYQVGFSSSRPVPLVLIGLYALRDGNVVGTINLGGIGQPWNPPPVASCFPVLIASDSQGKFGHKCPRCDGYWRSGPFPNFCPYCYAMAEPFQFISSAQRKYTKHYCDVLLKALSEVDDGAVEINMDDVADAIHSDEKPAFYVSEESQQYKFDCDSCEEYNDVLGRFVYCSSCGTRNDSFVFKKEVIPEIRKKLNDGVSPDSCLRDAISAFDSCVGQYANCLLEQVPLSNQRKKELERKRFYDFEQIHQLFKDWFDIDILSNIGDDIKDSLVLKFYRRHVYEHKGGEVDQKYLDNSGDQTVRLKQHISENKQDIHLLIGNLEKVINNLHKGFCELIEPLPEPIEAFTQKKARMKQ